MDFKEVKYLIKSDLHRYGCGFWTSMIRYPGFKYGFFMRLCKYMKGKVFLLPFYLICRFLLRHYKFKFGIEIPFTCDIKEGLKIRHFGTIVVSSGCILGKNCDISQGVTLGISKRGKYKGEPKLGNNIYIAPGAKIIGNIKIGDNSIIGVNCVVTKDIPENSVVAGNPGKIISKKGSECYIENKV